MSAIALATLLQLPFLAVAADPCDTYADAHHQMVETGKPLVVMVGATWCPACQQMEKNVIPEVKQRGLLRRLVFALVDLDRERELGHDLTGGGPIPQLILFRKTEKGWQRKQLIGGQTVENVEQFLVQEEPSDKKAEPASKAPAPPPPAKQPSSQKVSHAQATVPVRPVSNP